MTTHMTAEAPPEEKVLREWEKFEGNWELIGGEEHGWTIPEPAFWGYRLLIVGNRYSVKAAGEIRKGTMDLDPSKTPCEIDIHEEVGPFQGKTRLGIYEVRGGRMKTCIALPDQPRPTEFTSKSGTGRFVHVWKCDEREATEYEEEFRRFEGSWSLVLEEVDGEKTPDRFLQDARLMLLGDQYVCRRPEGLVRGVFKVDPNTTPKTIDISDDAGPYRGKIRHGIFRVEGGELEVCVALPEQPRPTEFSTKPGTGHVLHVWRMQRMQEE